MKKNYWISLLVVVISMCSCEKDIENELPPIPKPVEPGVEQVYLGVHPTITSVETVTRGVITNFVDNDKIGIFLTSGDLGNNYQANKDAANIPAARSQGKWQVDKDIEITTPGVVYAYYPYNNTVADGTKVPVEVVTQTDYLYAKAVVDAKNPIANITMKHALSMVSVRVRKNDYQLAGKLTKVEVLNIQTTGTMNIATGEVENKGSVTDFVVDKDILLNEEHDNLEKVKMIMLPTRIADVGAVRFRITLDGKYYTWDVPEAHVWESGKEYTYTINLNKVQEELPDLELDVDYWTQYGKDDNMVIGSNAAYDRIVDIKMGMASYGRTLVTGESFIFTGLLNTNSKAGFKGRVKYTLWQGDKMIEQFPSYYFEHPGIGFRTFLIPCYITCKPGTYRLKMFLQEDGKTEWFNPSEEFSEERDWMYTVKGDNSVPSIKSMNVEGEKMSASLIRTVKLNQPFNMEYTMTNRAGIALSGEIKAVWHRTFTGEFNLIQNADDNVWEDEIGRVRVSMTADQKEYRGKVPCKITIYRDGFTRYFSGVHFYYKADGSDKWEFMRSDSDSELQRWKDADIDKIIMGSNDHPERSWFCYGGVNYQHLTVE